MKKKFFALIALGSVMIFCGHLSAQTENVPARAAVSRGADTSATHTAAPASVPARSSVNPTNHGNRPVVKPELKRSSGGNTMQSGSPENLQATPRKED